jgi:SAM-dependent methyltransferase
MAETSKTPLDEDAIARAHAVYTPSMLRVYDYLVHGFSNRFAWGCPTERLLDLYRASLAGRHLEAGVGTGFFIDRAGRQHFERLVLVDINRHCLARSAKRLARHRPVLREANLLAPPSLDVGPVDSVGLTYVLHCLPGRMADKLKVVDHLRPSLRDGAVLFGATILGRDIAPNAIARALLGLYNSKGVFNNRDDDLEALSGGLKARFAEVEIERIGCVALFRGR